MNECQYCIYIDTLIKKEPCNENLLKYYKTLCSNCQINKLLQPQEDNTKKVLTKCCANPDLVEYDYIVCANCGTVSDTIIKSSIGNYNDSADTDIRGSYEISGMQNYGLNTSIKGYSRMTQLNKSTNKISHKQKVVYDLYQQLSNLESQGISEKYINQAIQYFIDITNIGNIKVNNSDKKNIFKGKRRKGMITVCLWLSFEYFNTPRSITELCGIFSIDKKTFYIELQRYNQLMGTDHNLSFNFNILQNSYFSKLNISFSTSKFIYSIIQCVQNQKILKGKPNTLISSVIFWVFCQIHRTDILTIISSTFNVSLMTIQKNVKILNEHKNDIFCILKKQFLQARFLKIKQARLVS